MRNLKHWIGAALLAQPFYAEEIRMIALVAQTSRFGLPNIAFGSATPATSRALVTGRGWRRAMP